MAKSAKLIRPVHIAPRSLGPSPLQDQALMVWNLMGGPEQVTLAREYVHLNGRELRRAYPGILSIGYGYRVKARQRALTPDDRAICITFLVRKKWDREPSHPEQLSTAIPPYLYAQVQVDQELRICAIPTDIQGLQHTGPVKPQSNMYITAISSQVGPVTGVPCCVVTFGDGPRYMVGCHHVFACSELTADLPPWVQICDAQSPGSVVANLSDHIGGLGPANYFFDAALAAVADDALLDRLVNTPNANGAVLQGEEGLAGAYQIVTASRIITASYLTIHHEYLLDYYGQFRNIVLPVVVEIQPTNVRAKAGDSGSPVFDDSGTEFQGMHIGSNDAGGAFFIPAYELLRASNYGLSNDDADVLVLS